MSIYKQMRNEINRQAQRVNATVSVLEKSVVLAHAYGQIVLKNKI